MISGYNSRWIYGIFVLFFGMCVDMLWPVYRRKSGSELQTTMAIAMEKGGKFDSSGQQGSGRTCVGQLVLRFFKISWIFIFQICFHWQVNEWATFAAGRILLRSGSKHSLKSCLTYVCRSCKKIWRGVSSWIFVCQDSSFGRERLVLRKPVERQVKFVFFRSTNGWFSRNSVPWNMSRLKRLGKSSKIF